MTEAEITITDAQQAVKDALDVWVEWQQKDDSARLGYGHCVGFNTSSLSGWDDFERRVEKNMAVNVQAIIEGLPNLQQMAIFHFHLAAVWRPQRVNIEECYQGALMAIEVALRRRGLI